MMLPLVSSGSSANVHYYGEPQAAGAGRVWCSVLCDTIERAPDGTMQLARVPTYYVTVYRERQGEVCRFTYKPKRRPNPLALRDRTVTRLVRQALGDLPRVAEGSDASVRT